MKILAISVKTKVLLSISGTGPFLLERKMHGEEWKVFSADGFVLPESQDDAAGVDSADAPDSVPIATAAIPLEVSAGDMVDADVGDGLYQYRVSKYPADTDGEKKETDYQYTSWVICGTTGPIGYTFGNYEPADGEWGDAVTPDDIRFTYMWGTDLKAANGQSYTDEQIRYFIRSSMEAIGRELDITIPRRKVRCNAKERGLVKNVDYDVNEDLYRFNYDKIARYGLIKTKLRPIINVEKVAVIGRLGVDQDITDMVVVDYEKGELKLLRRPVKPSATSRGLSQAIGAYGTETFTPFLFYQIDYEAGYETAAEIPMDLREIVAKHAAVGMLNVIGDGLMSGFSSSSLSMDGLSESFSSTQSATSAYFGARIKEYKDDISNFIKNNKRKFNNLPMGCI